MKFILKTILAIGLIAGGYALCHFNVITNAIQFFQNIGK